MCGVHNLSAVEAGWMTATSVFAAQQSSEEFQQAVKAARACAAETALLAKDPF